MKTFMNFLKPSPMMAYLAQMAIRLVHMHRVLKPTGSLASEGGAAALARQDPFQFQFWALGLIGARPKGGRAKKGADQGIDGVRFFVDEMKGKRPVIKTMLVQVKSGKVGARDMRDWCWGTWSESPARRSRSTAG